MNQSAGHFIELNSVRIREVCIGDGLPLLMLHGWGANVDLLLPLARALAPLGYACYMLDLPGFGQSDPPPVAWSVHEYANLVLAYLDHHHLDQVHLFGHSFGGRLGLVLGAEHPARLVKMALADSAGVPTPKPAAARLRLSAYKSARRALEAVGLRGPANQLRGWYNRRYGSADWQAVQGVMRETFLRVISEDLRPYAERVAVPTLLFWGDRDEDTPLWQGKVLEGLIPDAGLVVFEGAGHYSYLDHLSETTRVLHHFFTH